MSDAQDRAEALDDDKVGAGEVGEDVREEYPPDEALAVDMRPVPGETGDAADPTSVGRLVDPADADIGLADDEADAVADLASADEPGSEENPDDLSAEEAAVHGTDSPPMHPKGDGYV